MGAPNGVRTAENAAGRAGQSRWLENLARGGLLAYGVLHLLVAWLALQLAWGGGGGEADQSGALATLARQPFGKPLLWLIAVGLLALAFWQAAEALQRRQGLSATGKERTKAVRSMAKAVAKAVVYLVLAVLSLRFALGSGRSSAQSQQKHTAGVLGWPGGRVLVAIVAIVVIVVGIQQIRSGVTKRFLKQIDLADASPSATRLITRLGQVGFPAKGVALALVGCLFGWAAITFDAGKARGLDGAMRTILDAPFGQVLLTLVAVGIVAFGAFLFARARYPERT